MYENACYTNTEDSCHYVYDTDYVEKYPDQFRYDYAVSREQTNAAGQKMYIQTKMAEYTEELWDLMQKENTRPTATMRLLCDTGTRRLKITKTAKLDSR